MRREAALIGMIVAAAAVGLTRDGFLLYLASLFMVFTIFASAYNVVFGYLKHVSFGHSLFFAAGAYGLALTTTRVVPDMFVGVAAGLALAILLALAVGALTLRHTSIYFAMLTLAFAMLFYSLLIKWRDVTGGSDGISGIPRTSAFFSMPTVESFYPLLFLFFAFSVLLLRWIDRSRLGLLLRALGDNEDRFKFTGLGVYKYKLAGLVISGTFSGLAGTLYALLMRTVTPDVAYWTMAAEPLIMTLLGGSQYFLGPPVGAAVFVTVTTVTARVAEFWQLFMGIVLVALLLGARGGVLGLVERLWGRRF
ncbi:MAG: branched-chain amino acid ABC transporter permease [Thaumarchaeota archaeon]|nr:branched-chain amino acid ABC transporter permease [Candidatus Calditenuaceae archaeon]MDW8043280.1 branched-chain amino acid ABC transporter permease [Nitrososphaerota archaeon]